MMVELFECALGQHLNFTAAMDASIWMHVPLYGRFCSLDFQWGERRAGGLAAVPYFNYSARVTSSPIWYSYWSRWDPHAPKKKLIIIIIDPHIQLISFSAPTFFPRFSRLVQHRIYIQLMHIFFYGISSTHFWDSEVMHVALLHMLVP